MVITAKGLSAAALGIIISVLAAAVTCISEVDQVLREVSADHTEVSRIGRLMNMESKNIRNIYLIIAPDLIPTSKHPHYIDPDTSFPDSTEYDPPDPDPPDPPSPTTIKPIRRPGQ